LVLLSTVGLTGCSVWNTLKQVGAIINGIVAIHAAITALPPASDLSSFDASKAATNFSFSNMSFKDSSGTATIKLYDQSTGQQIAGHSFSFYINGSNQLHFSNPSSVTSWVRSYSNYPGYVKIKYDADLDAYAPPEGQSGTTSATAVYDGTAYSSASMSVTTPSGGGCRVECKQQ